MAIERIMPNTIEWQAYYANHIGRYEFAFWELSQKNGLKILDAACGVGYGSYFLANKMDWQLIAIDRSEDALQAAAKYFNRSNIKYLKDDCHTLDLSKSFGSFDAIISFETLEHLVEPHRFLEQCWNNLIQGGKLIISTPNKLVSSPKGGLQWEFHEKEYTPEELQTVLKDAGFVNITFYGQELTCIGRLKDQLRSELNRINSNPFIRVGRQIQKIFRKRTFPAVLPGQKEDFQIKRYDSTQEIDKFTFSGPFVLIAVCEKD